MSLEGSQLGHYRLQRLIGSGSMSEIYLAQDTHIPRQVAVKVLRPTQEVSSDSSTAKEAERLFEREMQTVSQLDHPHILPLFDYGTEQSDTITHRYLVMPYRPEGSLRDWLLQQQSTMLLAPSKIISLLLQAADALQHAHERHILHQDIKPDNFLIRRRTHAMDVPDILLADFGLAQFTDASSSVSQSVRGTPLYMPPEQWEGQPVPASDQYALAIMAFLLLTGHAPFRGTPGQVMQQHFHASPAVPSSINPRLSPSVDAVLLRALAKQPQERFPSVLQCAHALEQAFQQREISPPPLSGDPLLPVQEIVHNGSPSLQPTRFTSRPEPMQRSNGMVLLSDSGSSVASGAGIGMDTNVEQDTPPPLEDPGKTPAALAPRQSYGTSDSASNQETFIMRVSSRLTGLEAPMKIERHLPPARRMIPIVLALVIIIASLFASFSLIFPSFQLQAAHQARANATATTRAKMAATAQARQTATTQAQAAVQAKATANVQIIATAQAQGKPQVLWTFAAGSPIRSSPAVVNGIAYVGSNDGKLFAIKSVTGQQEWTFATRGLIYSRPAVVNGVVYAGSADWNLYAIDAMTGQEKWAFPTGSGISASPLVVDGAVYISSGSGKLYAIDTTTGQQKWVFTAGGPFWGSLIVANGVVYAGSIDHSLYAIDATTGREKWAFTTENSIAVSPAIANGVVYMGSLDSRIYAIDATTGQQKWVFATGDAIWSAPTVANGVVYVGSTDHKLYAINAVTGQQWWAFPTGDMVRSAPTVANGVVYVGSTDHKLYAINAVTGQQKWAFPTGDAIELSSPIVVNGVLYIGSNDHKLYAIAIG